MSGSASQDLEQQLLQHTLAIAPMAALERVYVTLCKSPPSEAAGGTELDGGGYTRVPAAFTLLSGSIAANATAVAFPAATTDWGVIGHFEIWSSAIGGSRLYWGPLVNPMDGTTPLTLDIVAGDIVRFSPSTLSIQIAEQPLLVGGGMLPITATGSTTPRSIEDREARVWNILDYGAIADGRIALTTAQITSTTLTVTDALFQPSDVGKIIGVAKRYTGTPLVNPLNPWINRVTITGYISSTQVTVPAPSTGSAPVGPFPAAVPAVVVWGTDNTPAFQAAADKCRDFNGGMIYVPRGDYVIADTGYLHSNTVMAGDGPASQILNAGIPGTQGSGAKGPMFANYNGFYWPAGTSKKATPWVPTTLANMIDHDITIRDLCLNEGAKVAGGNGKGCLFILARKIKFLNNLCVAPGLSGNGISVIGGWDIEETGNTLENMNIALDHWGGIQKLRIYSNTITEYPGAIQAININAAGITRDEPNITTDIVVHGNVVTMNGGPAGQLVGMFLDGLGGGGSVTECLQVTGNTFRATPGTLNQTAITMRGVGGRGTISGNVFDGLSSGMLCGGINGTATSLTTPWTVVSGETTAIIVFPSHNIGATAPDFEGPWIHVPNGTVAGLTFNSSPYASNELLVLTVIDADTVRVRLPTAATSSVTGGGMTGTYWVSLGAPTALSISDNLFLDMAFTSTAAACISIAGTGHHIGTNKIAFRDPAATRPPYATIVRCEAWGGDNQMVVRRQAGPDGLGPTAGYTGDGNVAWATGNRPALVDLDAVGGVVTQPVGTETTAIANTLFAARLSGVLTPTMPDSNTTFTSLQTGALFVHVIGTLTAARTVQFSMAGAQRVWIVRNGTAGGQLLGVVGTAGPVIWIAPGLSMMLWSDGGNMNVAPSEVSGLRIGTADRNGLLVTANATPTLPVTLAATHTGGIQFTSNIGFNSTAPLAKPSITGSRGGNAALADLLTKLASYGLITDTTTA